MSSNITINKEEIINICRICLSKNPGNHHTIFQQLRKAENNDVTVEDRFKQIHLFLMSFTDIKVEENDGLTHRICNDCLYLTQAAFNLYKLCNESQKYFNTLLEAPTTSKDETEIETERSADSDSDSYSEMDFETELPSPSNLNSELSANSSDISKTVEIKTVLSAEHANLETNPNNRRKFDYNGTYVEVISKIGKRQYECVKCKTLIKHRLYDFKRHYDLHLEPYYRCKFCNSVFRRQVSYRSHLTDKHKLPGRVKTVLVEPESTRQPGELETNPEVKRPTPEYGDKYVFKSIKHGTEEFICNECGKSFGKLTYFKNHYDNHLDAFYICVQCRKTFSSQTKFKRHLESHLEVKHICDVCGRVCKTKQSLQEHGNIHKNIRYPCPMCDKTFTRRGEVHRHKTTHSDSRPYICTYCGASFKTTCALAGHEKIHLGIKAHKCDQCDQAFIDLTGLYKHKRRHKNVFNFFCDQCDKRFKSKCNLKQHHLIHEEKRHQCDACLKKFTQAVSLRLHKKNCSGPPE